MQNKSKKLTSRLLSALLALACVLTLLPGVAVAAETMTMLKKEEGSMVLEKGAVLEDDGTYTIQLSAYATGTTTMVPQESSVPLDIVLVLDQSGSMAGSNLTALRTAVTNFVQTIKENAEKYQVDHRIAVVGFAGAEYNWFCQSGGFDCGIGGKGWHTSRTWHGNGKWDFQCQLEHLHKTGR